MASSFLLDSTGAVGEGLVSSLQDLFGIFSSGIPKLQTNTAFADSPHIINASHSTYHQPPKHVRHSYTNFHTNSHSPHHSRPIPTAFPLRGPFLVKEPKPDPEPTAIALGPRAANRQEQQPPTSEVSKPLVFPQHSYNTNNADADGGNGPDQPPKPTGINKGTALPRKPLSNPAFETLPKAPEQSLNLIRWHQNTTSQACDPLVLWKVRQGLIALKWHILAMQDHSSPPTGVGNRWKSQDFVRIISRIISKEQ
jgi:hypothetical protein